MFHYEINSKKKGFVLITVLLFMQIIIMLGLYCLQACIVAKNISRLEWQQNVVFMTAEEILPQLEASLSLRLPPCVLEDFSQNDFQTKSIRWWRLTKACVGQMGDFEYYYIVEPVGTDPCAKIKDLSDNPTAIAAYFRITLLVLQPSTQIKQMLQSTIVKPDNNKLSCMRQFRLIKPGRQTWREF